MQRSEFAFIEGRKGSIFVSSISPPEQAECRGGILYLPPFGEEMNKARRMVALQSRALAERGYVVRTVDLPGCGDSHGLLEEMTWADWVDAAAQCLDILVKETGRPVILWGLRMGALLCSHLASERRADVDFLIFWSPVLNGKSIVSSLLRLARAGGMLRKDQAERKANDPREIMRRGSVVEIGGYCLTEPLLASLEEQTLGTLAADSLSVHWIDVSSREQPDPSIAAARLIDNWRTQGTTVLWSHVLGDTFWSTVEISECPGLIDATCQAVQEHHADGA